MTSTSFMTWQYRRLMPPQGRLSRPERVRWVGRGFQKLFSPTSPGLRADLVVVGSVARGGIALQALPVTGPPGPIPIGSHEKNVRIRVTVGPWDGSEEVTVAADITIMATPASGPVVDVSAALLATRDVLDTQVVFGLGTDLTHAAPGTTYALLLVATSSEGAVRQVQLPPVVCRQ